MMTPRKHGRRSDETRSPSERTDEPSARLYVGMHPADVADDINRAPAAEQSKLFAVVDDDTKPGVLAELERLGNTDILEELSDTELSRILGAMAPDKAADLVSQFPEQQSERILKLMAKEESAEVRDLLKYEEDSAGGIMTPDVVAMKRDQSVGDAIEAIAYLENDEPFFQANVIDEDGVLVGNVDIWELLREKDRSRPLGELAHTDFVSVSAEIDQEEVARIMGKYDLNVVPVVDNAGRLVGRITTDDAIDVIQEEASEDIFRLAGSDDIELEDTSVWRTCLARLPWLMVTLFGGFIVSVILKYFHAHLSGGETEAGRRTLVLAAFVPTVLAMGGNTAIQSSTLVVRSIAVGLMRGRSLVRILLKEMSVGAVMGSFCGIVITLWVRFLTGEPAEAAHGVILLPFHMGIIVAIALFLAMTFAAVFGAFVPTVLHKMRIDPAVASGPFVTIATDVFGLVLYFIVTVVLVGMFARF